MGPSYPGMHVVSHKAIRAFGSKHPESRGPLDYWYRVTKSAEWGSLVGLKEMFRSADFVAPYTVFDIGGNRYRLIAEVNFRSKTVFIRWILTHKEYDKGAWKP
jgi:mRNA interferase HigB